MGFALLPMKKRKVKGYENMGIETLAKINDKKLFYFINSQNRTKIDLFCLTI
jgi:hypothetical protein